MSVNDSGQLTETAFDSLNKSKSFFFLPQQDIKNPLLIARLANAIMLPGLMVTEIVYGLLSEFSRGFWEQQ